ncbi:MAG TPA: VF_A0006 family four-cysteine protein [Stellaceae bacterium]|nr:VF_A0006 family four-cysteine protein [Stellaceae bacterium]
MAIKFRVVAAVAGFALGPALAAHAQTPQMQQTAQCVLSATRDTRSRLAVRLIRQACNDSVVNTGAMFERQRAYDQCLVQQLSGAQSDAAAVQIQSACRTAFPLF